MKRSVLVGIAALTATFGTKLLSNHLAHAGAATPEQLARAAEEEFRAHGFVESSSPLAGSRGVSLFACDTPFTIPLAHGPLRGEPANDAARVRTERILVEELSRYDRRTLHDAHLARVVVTSHLRESEKPIPSLPNCNNTMFIDASYSDDAFVRRLVHHELFHFIDFADDGVVGHDESWGKLNGFDFAYLGSGRDVRTPGAADISSGLPGFITRYATASLEEDKAELFSYMMTEPNIVKARAKDDPVLSAKVDALAKYVPR